MTDCKQTVLTDEQNAIIAARFPDDPANAVRAQSAIVEILSKLRAAGEPVLRIYAEGSMRTVTEWLDGAVDLPDGDYDLYAAPQASAEGVRQGWKLVPVEPTESMVVAGFESAPDAHFSPREEWVRYEAMTGCQQAAHRARLCWAAMLAAAPAAEDSAKGADVAQPKRRPYNASASMSEYGIFPECDAAQAPAKGADVVLPPCPKALVYRDMMPCFMWPEMRDYARAAVLADRQQRGGDVDERAAFEAWKAERLATGYGFDAFDIWQARAALAATKGESNG